MSMRIERILMTPEMAAQLLSDNYEGQRKLNKIYVAMLVKDMQAGKFLDTGDTIKLDGEGKVIDGQHRLAAVVAAGTCVMMTLATGVERDVYAVLDQGHKRTFGDLLTSRGVLHATQQAASTGFLVSMARRNRLQSLKGQRITPTINELTERWEADSDILTPYVIVAARCGRRFRFSPGFLGAFAAVASVTAAGDPAEFLADIETGANLEDGDPKLALRQALIDRLATPASKRYAPDYYQSLVVRAWNAHARGDVMKQLKGEVKRKHIDFFDPDDRIPQRWPIARQGYNAGGAR